MTRLKSIEGGGKIMPSGQGGEEIVLITGGAGFIGSNLAKRLLAEGQEVHVADNLITGQPSNIERLSGYGNFRFHHIDIASADALRELSPYKFSKIFHLACPTGVPNILRLSEEMLTASSIGTLNMLKLALDTGARLVFSSSAEVYGQPDVSPQDEHYPGKVHPLGPRSSYEEGKRFSEAAVKVFADKYALDAKVVRIFNAYGPGMSLNDQRVIPQLIRNIILGRELVIYGDGRQTRTFVYVDDLIDGILLVMDKGRAGEAYNLGSDDEISMTELAVLLTRIYGRKNGLVKKPHFIEDHSHRRPALDKAKSLGWEPRITLEEGLRLMIKSRGIRQYARSLENASVSASFEHGKDSA